MAEIETLSESAIVVMAGLRDASARRRAPTIACQSGYSTMFSIAEMAAEGLMLGGEVGNQRGLAGLDKAARGLCKRHLVVKRTLHTHVYYGLTEEGLALLARIEAGAGLTELVAAEHARDQATVDLADAELRARKAQEALRQARKERGARYALEALLDTRREYPLNRRGEGNA